MIQLENKIFNLFCGLYNSYINFSSNILCQWNKFNLSIMKKRKFIKFLFLTFSSFFLPPISSLYAKIEKKIINNSLTEEQKKIMFKEGTERPSSTTK